MNDSLKQSAMKRLANKDGVIAALAIDQRGAMKKMMTRFQPSTDDKEIEAFKTLVSEELTPYASSILLDPEYGLPASKARDKEAGLLLAYEKTGYDSSVKGRFPDLLDHWSVRRLKEAGADACKFLLYYDVDESVEINDRKKAFVERIASECIAEDLPFYLELLSYDDTIDDPQSKEYAQIKPRKVIEMMKTFSEPQFHVDVLKVEVPVNMNFVKGFGEESIYTKEQAQAYFLEQSSITDIPFIFLSAGVSADLFKETLRFAKEAGSTFNGVLCGRATWAGGVEPFIKNGETAAREWLQSTGRKNIEELNAVLKETATPYTEKN
ncbi:tagatose-bisphosphate aldolase [Candidatus Enterococcus clewellii]|uniref:Tagatose 1,6-diphosphate aldolase n=1 Tax=Candidatus Enterococcus clewellii TaxID=1834193 RepID=A0A242K3R7_9ENTE|nr:tagatose-bisphosphate aldolase [Enterococcus sp. 9E7_DIV0242]OTP13649.1 tagatose 1,6-diphosphate aldolase [Enterococcus sp. 9E7_DIV0242]